LHLIFIALFAPALFWILFFRYKDRYKPEPIRNLGISFLTGILGGFLCLNFLNLLNSWGISSDISALVGTSGIKLLVYLIFITGIIEEAFKLIPFIILLKYFKDFDEKIDSVVYASIIALGFACYENFLYMKYLSGYELFARGFASPLTHSVFASIWGYWIYIYYIQEKKRIMIPVLAFLAAAVFHGVYDFFSFSPSLRILSALIILFIWIWRIRLLERLHTDAVESDKKR